jgi:hypothetical protein
MVRNMKRNKIIKTLNLNKIIEHKKLIAFHEAGHAAGIHLNNKAKCLPPLSFKIIFKEMSCVIEADNQTHRMHHNDCSARVEGGRLVELLPCFICGPMRELAEHKYPIAQFEKSHRVNFEADIINLLIGPLAEAKHVANTDDELFNHKLVNLKALKNYGGSSDISLTHEYLRYLSADEPRRSEMLNELFLEAFNFVNDDENWAAITKLAHYILNSHKSVICHEEIVLMLDQAVIHFQHQMSSMPGHSHCGFMYATKY